VAAAQAPAPRRSNILTRPLIAFLYWRQPIVRGWARYALRLRERVIRQAARGYMDQRRLPLDPADRSVLRYWHHQIDRLALLEKLKEELRDAHWRMRADSGWHNWDLEIYGNRYLRIRVATVSERHGGSGWLTKVRVTTGMSNFCLLLMAASLLLAVVLLYRLWPFSRPAVLIPLIWWTIYQLSRWRVSGPVLGLIDTAAEKAGFFPIGLPAEPAKEAPAAPESPVKVAEAAEATAQAV
jgi:hypothetical protein